MATYFKKLTTSGPSGCNQTFVVPREVSRQWKDVRYVTAVFDGARLIITPHELKLE